MSFAWPWIFLALPLPWLLRRMLAPVPVDGALRVHRLPPTTSPMPRVTPVHLVAALAWLLLMTAAARPQMAVDAMSTHAGRSLMLAFDVSMSMATPDMQQGSRSLERLQAARMLADGYLARARQDRVGLVVFGSQAYLHTPPTYDLPAVRAALGSMQAGLAGRETALGDAIALGVKYLKDLPAPTRDLVLLTDGASTAGTLTSERAAWLARREGVRIHALGIGAINEADEGILKEICRQSGGTYLRATDGGADAFFDRIERRDAPPAVKVMRDLYAWPLALALLLAAGLALHGWRVRHAPWQRLVDAHLLPHLLASADSSSRRLRRLLSFAAWTCALLALAGAFLGLSNNAMQRNAAARDSVRVLVVDLSAQAAPEIDRIKRSLHALLHALAKGPAGDTALLVYAAEPYLVVPPTADAELIARFIPELAPDAMPLAGNHPERALRMAADLLARSNASTRDLVWIASKPAMAALPADIDKLRLSILHADLEEDAALRTAVERSGGILTAMDMDDAEVKKLADAMSDGNWTATGTLHDENDWAYLLLIPVLPLAALRFRRGLLVLLPLALWAGMLPQDAQAARPGEFTAFCLFTQGRHAEAAQAFDDVRWKAAAHYRAGQFEEAAKLLEGMEEPDALYNRGNALAKLNRLPEALAAYEGSLRLRPGNADTVFNRDLVQRLLNRGGGDDADRVAQQWLRSVPDDPGTLLRRKLQIEHQRRQSGESERPW